LLDVKDRATPSRTARVTAPIVRTSLQLVSATTMSVPESVRSAS
jgi:hypothetical protein